MANLDTIALVTMTAAGASTLTSSALPNNDFRGAIIGVNLGTVTSATVVVHVQGKDAASGTWYDQSVSGSLTTAAFTPLVVYPGVISTSTTFPVPLPSTWRVQVVITGGSAAVTGAVGASLIQ